MLLKDKLRVKGNTNAKAVKAVAFERTQVSGGVSSWKDLCASLVRNSYGISADEWGNLLRTAATAWHSIPDKYTHTWYNPVYGCPVFWVGGSSGAGHVAIADGQGNVFSNDFGPNGYVGDGRVRLVPITAIHAHDSALQYVGWAEEFLGVRVYG